MTAVVEPASCHNKHHNKSQNGTTFLLNVLAVSYKREETAYYNHSQELMIRAFWSSWAGFTVSYTIHPAALRHISEIEEMSAAASDAT